MNLSHSTDKKKRATGATEWLRDEYESIYNRYKDFFADIRGTIKDYCDKHNKKQDDLSCVPDIEIYNLEDNLSDGILFVGMNPSGADVEHYTQANKKNNHVFIYSDADTPYFKAIKSFVTKDKNKDGRLAGCGLKDCEYSVLDVFGVVCMEHKALEKDLHNKSELYNVMIDVFFKTILHLMPKVIVVANAFVRKLFMKVDSEKLFNDWVTLTASEEFGGYEITIPVQREQNEVGVSPKYLKTHIFFSSMLSGQRALDCGSRENLVWRVRNYLKNKI